MLIGLQAVATRSLFLILVFRGAFMGPRESKAVLIYPVLLERVSRLPVRV